MSEIWKPVPGYEGSYEVSSLGNVRSLNFNHETGRTRILRQNPSRGYMGVFLYGPGSKRRFTTHRLVMMAFAGPRPDGMAINHKNGIKTDNRAENLEYCTNSENSTHAYRTGLQSRRGEKHHMRKLCEAEVRQIYAMVHGGRKGTEVAKLFGVDQSAVSNIKRRRNWSHLVYS